MSTTTPMSDAAQLDQRDVDALTQYHSVLDDVGKARGAPGLYVVVSESGSEYLVDAHEETCSCPDHRYREVQCKHILRTLYAVGAKPIPDWVDSEAVDPDLGRHVTEVDA